MCNFAAKMCNFREKGMKDDRLSAACSCKLHCDACGYLYFDKTMISRATIGGYFREMRSAGEGEGTIFKGSYCFPCSLSFSVAVRTRCF